MDCYTSSIVVAVLLFAGALWISRDKTDGERLSIGIVAVVVIIASVVSRTGC